MFLEFWKWKRHLSQYPVLLVAVFWIIVLFFTSRLELIYHFAFGMDKSCFFFYSSMDPQACKNATKYYFLSSFQSTWNGAEGR